MPNNVTNKLIFADEHADKIISAVCDNGKNINFEKLIPPPSWMYMGSDHITYMDDFKCNWLSWSVENWGTKWNSYSGSINRKVEENCEIIFDTAWSPPFQAISAFANMFRIPFEHRYFDEGGFFWGSEKWGLNEFMVMQRLNIRKDKPEDKIKLCVELKGYDPSTQEEDQ